MHIYSVLTYCQTNLLTFYRNVYEAVDNDANYDIIHLDFSKAFDKVPHDRLLSNRKQRVTHRCSQMKFWKRLTPVSPARYPGFY